MRHDHLKIDTDDVRSIMEPTSSLAWADVILAVTWTVPSYYLKQCEIIVNWTMRNKVQWNQNQNSNIFIQENTLENVVSEMASILSRPQWVSIIIILVHYHSCQATETQLYILYHRWKLWAPSSQVRCNKLQNWQGARLIVSVIAIRGTWPTINIMNCHRNMSVILSTYPDSEQLTFCGNHALWLLLYWPFNM